VTYVCGVDVGGTFTDVVAVESRSRTLLARFKVPTTHNAPQGVAAGISAARPADLSPDEVWGVLTMPAQAFKRVIDVNFYGVLFSDRAAAKWMVAHRRPGSIVNLGSVSGTIANRGLKQAHYNAAKAGVAQLSRSLALEWADRGVRVNAVSPGYVRTPLARGAETSRSFQDYLDDIPMRRMAEPDEIVGPVVFLLSDAASYCTGAELLVDGGLVSW